MVIKKMVKNKVIKIGLELEGCYNEDYVGFDVGDYHDGIKVSPYFKAEHDGSLCSYNNFSNSLTMELVSKIIKIDETDLLVTDLRKLLNGNNEELNKLVSFNDSCGCHIHFSTDKKFKPNIPFYFYVEMRDFFFNKLDKSGLRTDLIKSIKKQYFRGYAKKLIKDSNDRGMEFNFQSESNNYGLEWRSFNLCGVESWDEMRTVLNIATESIKVLVGHLENFELFEEEIIEKPKLKTYDSISVKKKKNKSHSSLRVIGNKTEQLIINFEGRKDV